MCCASPHHTGPRPTDRPGEQEQPDKIYYKTIIGQEFDPKSLYEPIWQGSCKGFSSGSCRSCAKRLFWKGLRMGSRSHFLPAQEKPQKQASCRSFLWVHVVSAKEPFCQTFFRTASAPPEELLLQRSQSPAKQALYLLFMVSCKPLRL